MVRTRTTLGASMPGMDINVDTIRRTGLWLAVLKYRIPVPTPLRTSITIPFKKYTPITLKLKVSTLKRHFSCNSPHDLVCEASLEKRSKTMKALKFNDLPHFLFISAEKTESSSVALGPIHKRVISS